MMRLPVDTHDSLEYEDADGEGDAGVEDNRFPVDMQFNQLL